MAYFYKRLNAILYKSSSAKSLTQLNKYRMELYEFCSSIAMIAGILKDKFNSKQDKSIVYLVMA